MNGAPPIRPGRPDAERVRAPAQMRVLSGILAATALLFLFAVTVGANALEGWHWL